MDSFLDDRGVVGMTLQQIKCFCVLKEVLHYTKAAQQLYISQSSLSYAISELEKELGVPLFNKNGKEITLSRYGEAFFPYAQNLLNSLASGINLIEKIKQPTEVINFGYIYSLSFNYLPTIIKGFKEQATTSNLTFNFFQGMNQQIIEKLRSGSLDIALSTAKSAEGIAGELVFTQEIFLVVPQDHRLAGQKEVSLSELQDETFISINPNSSLYELIDKSFKKAGFTPKYSTNAEECNAMASLVGSHFGIALMPLIPALNAYNVSLLCIKDVPIRRNIYLLWPDDRELTHSVLKFKQYIIDNKESIDKLSPFAE